jgi:hypothetical protein
MEDPAVDRRWQRIADDLLVSTSQTLFLDIHPGDDEWFDVDVFLDNRAIGSFGRHFSSSPEEFIAALADYLCEFAFDGQVANVWPVCPDHGTHPLEAVMDENHRAAWRCPFGRFVARLGELRPLYSA